jgi:hypothetical protein
MMHLRPAAKTILAKLGRWRGQRFVNLEDASALANIAGMGLIVENHVEPEATETWQ